MSKSEFKFDEHGSWIWKDNDAREPNLVLFIHGYTGDPEATWVKFPYLIRMAGQGFEAGFDVASFGYESNLVLNFQNIETITGLLLTFIDAHAHENKNIFLVAHSLGGLVARRYLVETFRHPNQRQFFDKIRQVHFIGVPHEGAAMAPGLLEFFKRLNPLAAELRRDSPVLLECLRGWDEIVKQCAGEGIAYPTIFNYVGNKDWLAPMEQVIGEFNQHEQVRIVEGGHIAIAKPHDAENPLYKLVTRNILNASPALDNLEKASPPTLAHGNEFLPLSRPGSAPPVPGLFIGRDEALAELKERLGVITDKAGATQVLTAVRGWPGVGKTTIAAWLAHDEDIARAFPDGVLWVSLGENPNVLSEMATWGRALGTDDLLRAPTLKEATERLAALLRNKKLLLIVDDVWSAEHAIPFKQARGNACALLFTTREPELTSALVATPEAVYNLPVLTEDYAVKLLAALAPAVVAEHPNEAHELVRALECLPLALHVAGRLLNVEASYGWGVKELLADLSAGKQLLEAKAPDDRFEYETQTIPTVAALLKKSSDRLDEHTRECFAYLGAFAPKPATFDLAAMQAVWQVDDARPIVREIVARGLLEPVGGRFQMHALLVAHAQSLCNEE